MSMFRYVLIMGLIVGVLHARDVDYYLQINDCSPVVDEYTVQAIIDVESSGRSGVQSSTGARGLMQISPIALKHYNSSMDGDAQIGYDQLFIDGYNMAVGIWLICWAYDHAGNLFDALMIYHGGMGLFNRARLKQEDGVLRKYADRVIKRRVNIWFDDRHERRAEAK